MIQVQQQPNQISPYVVGALAGAAGGAATAAVYLEVNPLSFGDLS